MPDLPSLLPPLRRVVTTHDSKGLATVESNVVLEPEVGLIDQFRSGCLDVASKRMESIQGAQSAAFWVTTGGLPVNDNNIWSVCFLKSVIFVWTLKTIVLMEPNA